MSVADRYSRSRSQFERARRTLAGGVATAFRAAQRPVPVCFDHASGSRVFDVDGHDYIDYALGFGPLLLGHQPQAVLYAAEAQLHRGLGYGACHELEAELAEAVCRIVPSAEMCVFSNTGSEAVQVALRIARAVTDRQRVVKFRGHYHGWSDGIHIGVPGHLNDLGTDGQDRDAARSVILCDWNDIAALRAVLDDSVAAIIMEPIAVNAGCILPTPGYLEAVRDLASRNGSLLIFDEVITGFRVALGGAQAFLGVLPDLTVLGKALGGGFPISAVCGRQSHFEVVESRQVAHVGTFNANPVCAAAALAAVTTLERDADQIYPRLSQLIEDLAQVFIEEAGREGLPLTVNRVTGAAHAFVSAQPVETVVQAERSDAEAYGQLAAALLDDGVHVIPRGLLYVSTVHSAGDIRQTRLAIRRAAARVMHARAHSTSGREGRA